MVSGRVCYSKVWFGFKIKSYLNRKIKDYVV